MKVKKIKFRLTNPGFLMTFEGQAEVGELLIRDEIQDLIFQLCQDSVIIDVDAV